MDKEAGIILHFYQPIRGAYHEQFIDIPTDPENLDHTQRADELCYSPLIKKGLLDLVSFDVTGVLLTELKRRESPSVKGFTKYKERQAIGTSFIHPILPDLSYEDKEIVIGAGFFQHKEDFGVPPKVFWPPETAIDEETAEVLYRFGYKAFICAPHQLQFADGRKPDNKPAKIWLQSGGYLIALPFDAKSSQELAFRDKSNADCFTRDIFSSSFDHLENTSKKLIYSALDGETFGLHARNSDYFLDYLVKHSLPDAGIKPILVNDIDLSHADDAKLRNRTSWSCKCGDLVRWNRGCGCDNNADVRWKSPFYQTFKLLNDQVGEVVKAQIGKDYLDLMKLEFEQGLVNSGPKHSTREKSLIAAKVASLVSRTSCGTFYDNPDTSGRINILFGLVAIQHIKDAGLYQVGLSLEQSYLQNLMSIPYPKNSSYSLWDIAKQMLQREQFHKEDFVLAPALLA